MTLRPYQREALDAIKRKLWGKTNRQLVKLPTGMGKTPLFASLPDYLEFDGRMMVLVHREELADQAADKLRRWNPNKTVGIEMGAREANGEDLVVASVQTIGKKNSKRLQKFKPDDFSALVIDECHHATASTYRTIIDYFRVYDDTDRLLLGVTATPNRADGKGLGEVFSEIVYEKTILESIKDGWLSDLRGIRYRTDTSLDDVHTLAGDFNVGELSSAVNITARNHLVVKAWLEKGENRQTVVYCVDVAHAKALANTFCEYGIAAQAVWGGDPDRAEKLRFHREGKLKVICNCELLIEGYDDWRIGCIVCARPTQSETLYTQLIGRGTRIPAGIQNLNEARSAGVPILKEDCLVIDLVDVTSKHSLMTMPMLFGFGSGTDMKGKSVVKVMDEASQIKATKPFVDLSKVEDVTKMKAYAETVDLFKVEFPPEILKTSKYQWHKSSANGYVLLLKDREYMAMHSDLLGNWHIIGIVNGNNINATRRSFEEAIREADFNVELFGGRAVTLYKRQAAWHELEPTPSQLSLLKRFKVTPPPGATRGEVHAKISELMAKRKKVKV